jgi:urease accessory protein
MLDRIGRDGALRLRFDRRGARTVVTACRYTVPLQALAPLALDDPAAVVSVLNPTGGLVGGDRLSIDVVAGPGAHACLTTPSATKIYRTGGGPAEQDVTIRVEDGATVEYVPDHAIPFPGSDFRQTIRVELGDGARLIAVDGFAAGRIARGEAWGFRSLDSSLMVRDGHGWRLRDRLRLRGGHEWAGLGLAESNAYFGTVVVFGDHAGPGMDAAVAGHLAEREGTRVGWGPLPRGGWMVRILATGAMALTDSLELFWTLARRVVLGLGPLALRKS